MINKLIERRGNKRFIIDRRYNVLRGISVGSGVEEKSSDRKRVFISYGHDELMPLAKRIKKDLEMRGHEVWFDADRIRAGADWEQNIESGIDWVSEGDNGRIILLMTPYSVRRPDGYCLNELARAIQKNVKIIPVMLVWCEPPLSICRI